MLVTKHRYGTQEEEIRFLCFFLEGGGAVPLFIHVSASHNQCSLTTYKDQTTLNDLIIYT